MSAANSSSGTTFAESPAYGDWKALLDAWNVSAAGKNAHGAFRKGTAADAILGKVADAVSTNMRGSFAKLDEGSSRKVFAFRKDTRFALKVAYNSNGLDQNRSEVETAGPGCEYGCFARILKFEPKDFVFLVQDLCIETSGPDWLRLAGMPMEKVLDIVVYVTGTGKSLKEISAMCGKGWNEIDPVFMRTFGTRDIQAVKAFCDGVLNPIAPRWLAFRDMIRYYLDRGGQTELISDLGGYENWGIRKGLTPDLDQIVIIDSGIS